MLALAIADAADEMVTCFEVPPGGEDQECFYRTYDNLSKLVAEMRRLKLGDVDRVEGNFSHGGTDASKAAALKDVKRGSLRWKILGLMCAMHADYTVAELVKAFGRPHQTISSAVNDLMNGGWIKASGDERLGQTVWVFASEEARAAARERTA